MSKDEVLDQIAVLITMDDEDIMHTRDGYKSLRKKMKDLPTLGCISKTFGSYTGFKKEVGYIKDPDSPVTSSGKKDRVSLKDFLKKKNEEANLI